MESELGSWVESEWGSWVETLLESADEELMIVRRNGNGLSVEDEREEGICMDEKKKMGVKELKGKKKKEEEKEEEK